MQTATHRDSKPRQLQVLSSFLVTSMLHDPHEADLIEARLNHKTPGNTAAAE